MTKLQENKAKIYSELGYGKPRRLNKQFIEVSKIVKEKEIIQLIDSDGKTVKTYSRNK
jgi:hypothetical protein